MQYPIIFLDIDHVLTNIEIDNTSFLNYDPDKYKLSEHNLKYLNMILDATHAKIVIASNWRKFTEPNLKWMYDGKWYNSPLPNFKRQYNDYIIDSLPPKRHITKCEALSIWCENNSNIFDMNNDKYVILEDDIREGYQNNIVFKDHLILTNCKYGLTESDAKHSIEILKGNI